jgi:CRP-like cAMP-binding protein
MSFSHQTSPRDPGHIHTTARRGVFERDQTVTGPSCEFAKKKVNQMKNGTIAAELELIEALRSYAMPIFCGQDQTLFTQGEACSGLYVLESGKAALVMNAPSGRAIFFLNAGPGSLLGLPAVVGKVPYSMTAMVKKGATVRFVTSYDFEKLIEADPQLYPEVLQLFAAEVRSARLAFSRT